jgi:DNA-binding CsgD family transcriptional regulator
MARRVPNVPCSSLSPREREVVALILQLNTNKAIAAALGCSVKTVEYHVSNILRKTGVESRTELIVRILRGERLQDDASEGWTERPSGRVARAGRA